MTRGGMEVVMLWWEGQLVLRERPALIERDGERGREVGGWEERKGDLRGRQVRVWEYVTHSASKYLSFQMTVSMTQRFLILDRGQIWLTPVFTRNVVIHMIPLFPSL